MQCSFFIWKNMKIIACCDSKGGFAKNKQIPWMNEDFCKVDLQHFKRITDGSVIVMGRNTYNEIASLREINASVLPNRECYVVSSDINNLCKGAQVIGAIDEIVTDKKIFIIGGYQLYYENLLKCDEIYLTRIDGDYDCDQFFPLEMLEGYKVGQMHSGHPKIRHYKYINHPGWI